MIKIWVTTNDDKIEDVVATSMTPKDVFAKHGKWSEHSGWLHSDGGTAEHSAV